MIEIKGLCKKFGDQQVLDHIDLRIERGKVVVVIGPSGTGKSTLLRCINVLERPEEGHIRLEGFETDFATISKQDIQTLRSRTSMVFQNSNLYRNKTALQNITTPLTLVKKINREEAEKTGLELLKKVGMLEKRDAYPETLSGGERQRVGIARAMAVNPDIILFDEPTSALDPELVNEVLDVIRELARQHTTMLIVTHEMKFARSVADEIVFMEGGHIVEQAPPEKFFTSPEKERTRQFIQTNME
ncbi:amino acid ABC transporter ATP-binding protein [Faecalicatena contorta]|uniref:amino acid ABC transporter ATP-binding protein n=1 Tax=Lachnospiraceae TaxID=186803 RepID=UPI00195FEBDF|nr:MULTISPECIES: amino acid ABC transporter ATP-binding protein [Lachnospiraceae]MBM6685087.1 amino acid ABC transporter ATP-binding protein [Faecalicatena contorta]MBM6710615.1 amino acid ABC transporter ATP-binding protein [Faecalicatena contorta]